MDLLAASIKENLWHKLRQDLKFYYTPQISGNDRLMCCTCGRFLPYEDFNLEHIIPQQALADDPREIKSNPETTANARSGNILLCSKPLLIKGRNVYKNGCNSWKGRFYDSRLRELLNGHILSHKYKKVSNQHIIAAACSAYLAMVLEFGYQVALTPNGLLMRQQFFLPYKFHRDMPLRSQIILAAPPPISYDESDLRLWSHPFTFTIKGNSCYVGFRTMSLVIPISRDPRSPISKSILIAPSKYTLRPDFQTVFD
jgi:hypothetical protein